MIFSRSTFAPLLLCLSLAFLVGCKESDDARYKRMNEAIQNAGSTQLSKIHEARPDALPPLLEISEEEKIANDPTKKLVLFCSSNLKDPFQYLQAELMRAAVRTVDGYRYKVFDAAGDLGKQADQIREAENEKPTWLIVQPLDDRLIASLVEGLHAKGTHIIGLDQRLPAGTCDAVMFTDQRKLGHIAGEIVVESLRRKAKDDNQPTVSGRVVQIRGLMDSYEAKERAEGFAEAIHEEPGIVIVHDAPGNWTAEAASRVTEDAIRLQHQFDVVFAHNDTMAHAASEALLKAQLRESTLIVGIDGVNTFDGGLDLLRRSIIDATIWQPMPMESAFLEILKTIQSPKASIAAKIERQAVAVTPKNIDQFSSQRNAGK